MSSKKRVYDLAKEYGMSGQELAAKLREMGFSQVKTHMTALKESDLMLIEGRLDAYGYTRAAVEAPAPAADGGGLIVKKKKRRKKPDPGTETAAEPEAPEPEAAPTEAAPADDAATEAVEPEPTPAPAVSIEGDDAPVAEVEVEPQPKPSVQRVESVEPAPEVTPEEPAPTAAEPAALDAQAVSEPVAEQAPEPATDAQPAPAEPAAESVEPAPAASQDSSELPTETAAVEPASEAPEVAAETPVEGTPAPAEAREPDATAEPQPAAAETGPAAGETPEPAAAEAPERTAAAGREPAATKGDAKGDAPSAKSAPSKGGVAPAGDAETKDADGKSIVRPSEKRRQGKVVGFIDLSKIQPDRPARRESRRHRSADDLPAPNVQPTMGRDRRRALSRGGDVQRNDLTAAQLREREAGRFLRRQRPGGPGGPGGGGGRRGGGRQGGPSESPYRGQTVQIELPLTVKKLAETMSVKANDLLKTAFRLLGFGAVNINTNIDEDTAELLAAEFEVELEVTREIAAEEALISQLESERESVDEEHLETRPPTIAILGHVDHGKTTLIDTIRRSQIAGDESGGITQHIGAYQVETQAGHRVTVVDTPGHAAFTSMRARGAKAVDIVVLVVAADDGVMPQTEEAINHAKAAGTPVVVALNKIDKPEAQPDKVMNQLSALDLIPEEWGGQTAMMAVSALNGTGIDELLERVYLEAEVLELDSHPTGPASGVVLEAEIQQGRGIVAHLLIQDGSLERGQVILAGEGYGKVRSIQNDRGQTIEDAGPSTPVEVSGLDKLPGVGERFHVVPDLQAAKEVAEERAHANRMMTLADRQSVSRENLFEAVAEQSKSFINLVVKADVQGSVEVLKAQLAELTHDEVAVKVLHAGVGAIAESDVDLATTSDATIVAFHVGTNTKARQLAERSGVDIRNYRVIYEVLDDVRMMMEGQLAPAISEEITGHVEIRRIFRSSRLGNIAGSHVIDGTVNRDSKLRLLRDGNVVFTGEIGSLRRESDDAKEVREGFDCGIVIKNYNDIQEGDIIEAFRFVETKRTI
ncbi:MAG: translation initiation factor IF-2 [Planctomycetota bacterium]